MKRTDRAKDVKKALSWQKNIPLDMPVVVKGIKQTMVPLKVGGEVLDRKITYLRLKLPNGAYVECKLEGTSSLEGVLDALTEDPHFESVEKANNVHSHAT